MHIQIIVCVPGKKWLGKKISINTRTNNRCVPGHGRPKKWLTAVGGRGAKQVTSKKKIRHTNDCMCIPEQNYNYNQRKLGPTYAVGAAWVW
jgi:hypothetical protein